MDKLHTRTNAEGLAIGCCLTPSQASDMTAYDRLMDEGTPGAQATVVDKGYDSNAIRDDLGRRGPDPVIPTKANRKFQRPIDRQTYAMRSRVERFLT